MEQIGTGPIGVAQNYFPSKEEMKTAQLMCCGRYCNQCETPAEYAWRKREVDMSLLLEIAIEKELSKTERDAVVDHWFNSLGLTQIATKRGISPAAVKNTLDRASGKLARVLSYVVMYQQGVAECSVEPLIIGRARVIAAARNGIDSGCADRIMRLRESRAFSIEAVSDATCIPVQRLRRLEDSVMPNCCELIALSELYGVSIDFILKGDTNDRKQNTF